MRNENLRRVCEDLGLARVSTVISSGNVVFETDTDDLPGLEERLERAWPNELGFESTTIIRTREDLKGLVGLEPFSGLEHGRETYLLVTFSKSAVDVSVDLPFQPEGGGFRLLHATERELFTVTDTTQGPAPDVMQWVEARFGKEITSRTWLTVARILKKMD